MNKLYYNVSIRPLRHLSVGHQYDHNNLTVIFEGFTRVKDNSTIYVKMGSPIEAMVPLSDNNELVVQNYMTKESTRGIPCQLVEYGLKDGEEGTYELINSSRVFYACVDESVAEEETPEVTDPSLDLIYTQMHKMYLSIKSAYESGEFKGQDGYTPIKGTDYWTDADKQEIVDDTVEAVHPTLDKKADKTHTHMSSDIQMYEGDTDYTLDEYMEDVDHDQALLFRLSDSFISFPIHDYNKSASYKAGFFVLYYVDESDIWSCVVYKSLKDVPGNTEETYLDNTDNPPGIANGYWKKYYIQDELSDLVKTDSVLMSVIESSDPPDDYAISYSYQAGTIAKCNGIYYRCLKATDHHNYNTELPSPGVENGFWEPLTTLTNLYPATYMANEWKAQGWKVGQIVTCKNHLFKCIKETYSWDKDTPDNDTEHWERYEGTSYGDELVASIETKADKKHTHDFDEIQDKTRTLSVWADNIEDGIDELRTCMSEFSAEILNRYTKSETYSQEEVNDLISKIPKFAIEVVDVLPTSDISETTVYLLKTSETETNNLYTEYVYIDSKWEMLGTQKLDLSNYYKSSEVDALLETEKTERQNAYSDLSTNILNEAMVRESADKVLERKITDEITTARAAEQANATAISDEVTRAKAAESKNAEDITSEVSRAKASENVLQSTIDAEAKTRKEADTALETKVSDEATRAKTAENTLQSNIDSETKARKEADTTLHTDLNKCLYIDSEGYICLKEA